jgi:hypothetical protein
VPTPLQSFTDHTLPITSLHIGIGTLTSSRIFSSSLDSTVKIWCIDAHTQSESPDPTFTLLVTWSLPHPIGELVVDPLERFLFAASAGEGGEIWCVKLFTEKKEKMSARSLVNGNMGETLTSSDKPIIVGYDASPSTDNFSSCTGQKSPLSHYPSPRISSSGHKPVSLISTTRPHHNSSERSRLRNLPIHPPSHTSASSPNQSIC